MIIKVLGTGCVKCRKLYKEAEKAVAESGVSAELVKVEKIDEIISHGVAMTPALVIDGEVKSVGKVPSAKEIKNWISKTEKAD